MIVGLVGIIMSLLLLTEHRKRRSKELYLRELKRSLFVVDEKWHIVDREKFKKSIHHNTFYENLGMEMLLCAIDDGREIEQGIKRLVQ